MKLTLHSTDIQVLSMALTLWAGATSVTAVPEDRRFARDLAFSLAGNKSGEVVLDDGKVGLSAPLIVKLAASHYGEHHGWTTAGTPEKAWDGQPVSAWVERVRDAVRFELTYTRAA